MTPRAVLLDMDGTIFDSQIDFLAQREAIGLPRDGRPILAQIQELSPELQHRALSLLHEAERKGAQTGVLIPGTERLLRVIKEQGAVVALVTNNSKASLDTFLQRFPLAFDVVLSREDGVSKPAPDLFHLALDRLDAQAADAIAVGDTHLDGLAAAAAGVRDIVLINLPDWMQAHVPADVEHHHVQDLRAACDTVEHLLRV